MNNENELNELQSSLTNIREEVEQTIKIINQSFISAVLPVFSDMNEKVLSLTNNMHKLSQNKFFQRNYKDMSAFWEQMSGIASIVPTAGLAVEAIATSISFLNEVCKDRSLEVYGNTCKSFVEEMMDFYGEIKSVGNIFDGFSESILIANTCIRNLNANLEKTKKAIVDAAEIKRFDDEYIKYFEDLEKYYAQEDEYMQKELDWLKQRANIAVKTQDLEDEQLQIIINSAEEQHQAIIKKANEQYEEELYLLNLKYENEESMYDEAWQKQVDSLRNNRDTQIQIANDTVAEINKTLTKAYAERIDIYNMEEEAKEKSNNKITSLNVEYNNRIAEIQKNHNLTEHQRQNEIAKYNMKRYDEIQKIKANYLNDLILGNEKEISTLMTLAMETIKYGGTISEETETFIMEIIDSWDSLPEETKSIMKNVLSPMLEEMKKMLPKLEGQAADIANRIINKFNKIFKISSPSRKTREIFRYLMEGCELGLEDEKAHLLGLVDSVSNSVLDRMYDVGNVDKMFMAKQYHLYSSANSASVSELNRRASAKGIIHTTLNIDGREFAIATSNYMQEELAFKR